jgi:chlorobactene glucosyltransferase
MKQRSAGKPDIELGKRIRLRRVEQKISQAELGDKLGVSFQQVQKYEKGVNRVGAARLQQIATALDVQVTFFYDGDGKAREVESLLVPVIGFGIFTFIPIRLVQKLRLPALSVTIGQFMLFRREAYDLVGGYEAVRSEIVDDMCLGRRIITNGREWRLLDGTHHVTCRMYHGFWEAVGGFSKSLFAVFDYRIIPYVLGWSLVGLAFLEPVLALVSRWLRYPLTGIPTGYAALSVMLSIVLWMVAYRRFKFPAYLVFYYPISLALFIAVAARSFFQTAKGTATWKDRVLDRVAMRWL